jgi:hypothetical protein
MKFECPYGWKSVTKCGNVRFESATVTICDGVCDSCDLCGIESCEFYDISPEATSCLLAQAGEHTPSNVSWPRSTDCRCWLLMNETGLTSHRALQRLQ